jgi:hypothetical protein
MEARLIGAFDPRVTAVTDDTFETREFTVMSGKEAGALGVEMVGDGDITVIVTNPERRLGLVRVMANGPGSVLFFDNRNWSGGFEAHLRMLGENCLIFLNDIADRFVVLREVFLRASQQMLYWGVGASAVGLSIELEGEGQSVSIGDDALISGGVWIRNHDMHAIHDLRTAGQIGKPAVDTVIERHVWLGQDALLLSTERVGMGAIVGARALVKGIVPPRVAVGGVPARVLREGVSWGRSTQGMTPEERVLAGGAETSGR